MRRSWKVLAGFVIGVLATLWLRPKHVAEVRIDLSNAERELDRPIPKIDLDDVPFDRAVEELRRVSPLPVELDPAGVAASGFDRKATVPLHGSGVPLGEILRRLLSASQGPWLDFFVSNGRIIITAPWTATDHSFVRAYDVGRFLKSDPLLLGSFATAQRTPAEELVSYLTDGVTEHSGSKSWVGVIGNRLIVCQTWEGHRQVRELLTRFNSPTLAAVKATGPQLHWDQFSHSWLSSGDEARIDEALRRPIPRIQFNHIPLETVINGLSELSGVRIVFDLDNRGESYSPNVDVSLDLHDAPLWVALSRLATVHINGWRLNWWVEGGVVVYSYHDRQAVHDTVRVYDVSDLGGQAGNVSGLLAAAVGLTNASGDQPFAAAVPGRPDRLIVRADWATQEAFASTLAALRAHPPATQPVSR
jgi:hypothetical protein